ncbi:MAG: ABC-F family ATP-binding cassette domain-containing protein [Ardenticatenales bacterium]|nr:ABC-F family ATP-binding cassette domain-containing protein [Ardenticatenales bacterium]
MSLLSANGLAMRFGADDLFGGVTVSVPHGARIGLVGPNGIGKTTLLLILAGEMSPSAGSIAVAKGARIGYLKQEAMAAFGDRGGVLYDEMLAPFAALRADEAQLAELEHAMADAHAESSGDAPADALANDALVERYGRLQAAFELAGGYTYPQRIRHVLLGLGFGESAWQQPLAQLSGGQKTRALLARLLLEAPDLLILDEPTNHLDIRAIEWLEGMLAGWPGAVVVVSHDRFFLDRVVGHIWELGRGGMETYRGNYSAYVQQREARWELRRKQYKAVKERFEKEIDYIKRFIDSQNTAQAIGRLRRLGREVEALHAGGIEMAAAIEGKGWARATGDLDLGRSSMNVDYVAMRVGQLREPSGALERMRLKIKAGPRGPDIVVRSRALVVGYPGAPLVTLPDLELRRGARVGVLGPNGAGKTTLLKTVLGQLPPLEGDLKVGDSIVVGYFAQARDDLADDDTVIDTVLNRSQFSPGEARNCLAGFLFREDDVFKKVSALSGGERGRLALAVLALQGANLLVLDEPTNHLDIQAQEVLEDVVNGFQGTVLLVTHDRYLVDRLATMLWWVADGRLTVHDGTYADWQARQAGQAGRTGQATAAGAPGAGSNGRGASRAAGPPASRAATDRAASGGGRNATAADRDAALVDGIRRAATAGPPPRSKNELRRLADHVAALEDAIAGAEARAAFHAEAVQRASEAGDVDGIREATTAMAAAEAEVAARMAEWEAAAAELDGA